MVIAMSQRPVMIVGSQATLQPDNIDKLANAVGTLWGSRFILTGMARGLLGRSHPHTDAPSEKKGPSKGGPGDHRRNAL